MTIHIGTLLELPEQAHTVILIGSRSSDHLRELIRIAEYKGRAAYRIESAAELQPRWFAGEKEVGIVIGAEEMKKIVGSVLDRLDQFSAAEAKGMLEGVAQ